MYQQPRFQIPLTGCLNLAMTINSTQDDTDGVSSFDFSITTPDIKAIPFQVRHMI
jgi:hypothetical protein